MGVTSTQYKNTSQIDEVAYEKFIQRQLRALNASWALIHPDEDKPSENELRQQAEDICSMYKHHFRIVERVRNIELPLRKRRGFLVHSPDLCQ